jgi:hypothetical protein
MSRDVNTIGDERMDTLLGPVKESRVCTAKTRRFASKCYTRRSKRPPLLLLECHGVAPRAVLVRIPR